jgi:nucleoside-diphosphate-sugar epimerase
MSKSILITGISGFIGRHVAAALTKKHSLTALVRPGTDPRRIEQFKDQVTFEAIDLTNIPALRTYLKDAKFDSIIHIGALRGGRSFPQSAYFDANVNATEQLALFAQETETQLLFCSSVGVFGAIPQELPATSKTPRQKDNYYHFTKIQAERIIQRQVLYGLDAAIVRPAITYGPGDYGFPYTLTKLVDKKLLVYPREDVTIHLTHVDLMVQAFVRLLEDDYRSGSEFIVADRHPVQLTQLADFISNELRGKAYPASKAIDKKWFALGENCARFFKSELWTSRFELISKSWYYDTEKAYSELGLKPTETIPTFRTVTSWYKNS